MNRFAFRCLLIIAAAGLAFAIASIILSWLSR
jgi:hypothetical protein